MQNAAIQSRTQLRLESEIEEQKSKLADFKLTKEQERTKLGKSERFKIHVCNLTYNFIVSKREIFSLIIVCCI